MKKLDCQALECPLPVVKCREFLEKEKPSIFQVLVDNETASINVGRFLEKKHYVARVIHDSPRLWRICASLDPQKPAHKTSEELLSTSTFKTLIMITADTIGRGDEDLGTKLMNSFLSTLPEMGDSLWRLVLLNSGVKLAATEGPALTALKALDAAHVSILVCGTCLDHYGLADKKAVGQTSNMLDIITSLDLAQKVIRP